MKHYNPSEFRQLPLKKKAHYLAVKYLGSKCFKGGRPTTGYFQLRNTFLKAKESDLTDMFLFLSNTDKRPELKVLWSECHIWNESKREQHETSDYQKLSVDEL